MLMLGFNETIGQLAMDYSVHWYGHVLRREDGHVFRRAFDFEVDDQGKNGRPGVHGVWKMHYADQCGLLVLICLLIGCVKCTMMQLLE